MNGAELSRATSGLFLRGTYGVCFFRFEDRGDWERSDLPCSVLRLRLRGRKRTEYPEQHSPMD